MFNGNHVVYIAGSYERKEELKHLADYLASKGCIISSVWLYESGRDEEANLGPEGARIPSLAVSDLEGVESADVFIVLSEGLTGAYRGSHLVEFGYFLKVKMMLRDDKKILVVGDTRTLFENEALVDGFFDSLAEAAHAVGSITGVSASTEGFKEYLEKLPVDYERYPLVKKGVTTVAKPQKKSYIKNKRHHLTKALKQSVIDAQVVMGNEVDVELELNDIVDVGGTMLTVVEDTNKPDEVCKGCYWNEAYHLTGQSNCIAPFMPCFKCTEEEREDGKSVLFAEVIPAPN